MKKKAARTVEDILADPRPYVTMADAAFAYFNCSPITLRRRIARGEAKGLCLMDPFKRGKPLITKKSLEAFFLAREKATAKEFRPAAHLYAA